MTLPSLLEHTAVAAGGTLYAPWAAEAQAEIATLYHQIEGRDPNDTAMISWARQLIAGTALSR
jgi:hypothetical protein